MDNMLVVALLVVSCILINPFVSAAQVNKVAATQQTQSDDQGDSDEDQDESDEDEEEEDEETSK